MGTSVTVRNLDPRDKSWLRGEARRTGVSMAEVVRRLIHEQRIRSARQLKPSEAFALCFGEEHGVEALPLTRYGYRPTSFSDGEQ